MSSSAMASSSAASERAATGSGGGGGGGTAQVSTSTSTSISVFTAPIIEPPVAFGIVAPGIYRCGASSLTQGLPAAPRHYRKDKITGDSSSSSASGSTNGSQSGTIASVLTSIPATPATPTESFLSSLHLKTIVLLAPEKKPASLASWCTENNIQLIHLGLGALANREELGHENGENGNDKDRLHPSLSLEKSLESYGGLPDAGILSLERIVKDSLEILLHRDRLPCLVCDTSGVNETGVVVGCLRRTQRRSFASIRYEYRTFAGNRSRSSHERFIEMFDPDLISLSPRDHLPVWFAQQQIDDELEESSLS